MSSASHRMPYKLIGQVKSSMDCGYFAGYVVGMWNRLGPTVSDNLVLSQEDVYLARNKEIAQDDNAVGSLTPHMTGIGLNSGTMMIRYLDRFNCTGYKLTEGNPNNYLGTEKEPDMIRALLRRHVPPNPTKNALLLSVYAPMTAHWVAILFKAGDQYGFYDPGKKTGSPYGVPLTEEKIIDKLSGANIQKVVWRFRSQDSTQNRMPNSTTGFGESVHRAVSGESLSVIAGNKWGDVLLWPLIWDANKLTLPNPHQLQIGMPLKIPDISNLSESDKIRVRQRGRTGG